MPNVEVELVRSIGSAMCAYAVQVLAATVPKRDRWRAADGSFIDTKTVGPAESFRIRWREDAVGAWLYHCHVEGHMDRGMIGLYRVSRR